MLIDCIIGYINHNKINTNQSINRYRDNNELKYCIRSIEKYLPNLNKIHIILGQNCKPPDWLNLNNKKLNVIKESELYNPIQLNSETKKLYYHKIKNLTEYFITFDDDFYLNKQFNINNYFNNNKLKMGSVGYSINNINNISYFNDGHGHIPILWNKKQYKISVSKLGIYYNIIKYSGLNRYNPWCIMKKYLLSKNLIINSEIKLFYINNKNINNLDNNINYYLNYRKNIDFININDDFSNNINKYKIQIKKIIYFLNYLFPDKSSFEL